MISSHRVNTIIRWRIKQLGISFGSCFLHVLLESSPGVCTYIVGGENSQHLALSDSPKISTLQMTADKSLKLHHKTKLSSPFHFSRKNIC